MTKPPREQKSTRIKMAERRLLQKLDALEHAAHSLGFHCTARALNNAKNACGWEMAGNVDAAARAAIGKRIGEDDHRG